jgi:hypothetical protein
MKKTTLYVVAPDGSVHTRTTHRPYTHAVLVGPRDLGYEPRDGSGRQAGWDAVSFHASEALAARGADKTRACWPGAEVVIGEVSPTKPVAPKTVFDLPIAAWAMREEC